jgi:hypothetical protein
MTDTVLAAIITGCASVISVLLTILISKVAGVHKLVNSAASAQQAKIDSSAGEIVALKDVIMQLQHNLPKNGGV